MGAWSTGITGNDTAKDLYTEYSAAFYKFDVQEALERIDRYVRAELFDESDPGEWCDYYYSLADFMWKKGILTEPVREKAIEMIDSGFGLEGWAEAGQKTLDSRKRKLEEFKTKLLFPQPPKKKIKPNAFTERIFEDGDVIAVQLQTAGKPYTEAEQRMLSEEEFHAFDGKYVLMQLVNCKASWSSAVVPEVKDYWACFRLFDSIYDTIPDGIDPSSLGDAFLHQGREISPCFICESNMFYFKRRKYRNLGNYKELLAGLNCSTSNHVFWGINRPWSNPDSQLVAAMGKKIVCGECKGADERVSGIVRSAIRYGRFDTTLSKEENEEIFATEEKMIAERIESVLANGGKLYGISFGREIGIVTVENGRIANLYIEGKYQAKGFGTRLLAYAASCAGTDACMELPNQSAVLRHLCEKTGVKILPVEGGADRGAEG